MNLILYWMIAYSITLGVTHGFINSNTRRYHAVVDRTFVVDPIFRISFRDTFLRYPSSSSSTRTIPLSAVSDNQDDNEEETKKEKKDAPSSSSSTNKSRDSSKNKNDEREKKKQEIMEKLKAKLEEKKQEEQSKKDGTLLDVLNPFKAGQNVRKTIGTLTSLGSGLPSEARQKYYLDDRFQDDSGAAMFSERNPYLERLERDNYVPEVLVIGATGRVGQLVVRRLLLEGRFRVRVLVRDLYSKTLNLLGTGVTYCQGDLADIESLEYAMTDVDKIVFCATAPRPDETDFQTKFQNFVKETLEETKRQESSQSKRVTERNKGKARSLQSMDDTEWEQLASVMEVRAQLAEQIDSIGMKNVVRAYQNVRHADYGTSQAAKRSLFKFRSRPGDFDLFSIDDGGAFVGQPTQKSATTATATATASVSQLTTTTTGRHKYNKNSYNDDSYFDESGEEDRYAEYEDNYANEDDEFDNYDDYVKDGTYTLLEQRRDATVQGQCRWIHNEFGHGAFLGKIPKATSKFASEASIISSRLRAREDPENGLQLGPTFGGFIVRLVGDGSTYEAFVRTKAYEEFGVEYVCEFSTATKSSRKGKSKNKFLTVRLPFERFKPVARNPASSTKSVTPDVFKGKDVRHIGFRFRSASNEERSKLEAGESVGFYVAIAHMKVYRSQPEPEFVYLSDARIPRTIRDGMVRHDRRQLFSDEEMREFDGDMVQLFDETAMKSVSQNKLTRSKEETYFKYLGEEVLKNSGLGYSIIRVSAFNELQSGEASTIDLHPSNEGDIYPVSRDEAAQVCVSALLDPNALNKSVYMSKRPRGQRSSSEDENISAKFEALPKDLT